MEYKYEVAFTLLEENKEIGRQINNLIKNIFTTFIYFENITEVGAQNGLERFYNIFNNESRIVVILHSEKWGKTEWTSKEEKAIQDRIVKDGWDFIIIVKLDKKVESPKWFPNPEIYVDYESYGPEGVASVIENKVRQSGCKIKVESLEERAKRINEERNNLLKIKQTFAEENVGIRNANDEVIILFKTLNDKIINLKDIASDLYPNINKHENNYIQIQVQYYILNIHWIPRSRNFLEGSHLDINLKKLNLKQSRLDKHFDEITTITYFFDINPSWINGWKEDKYKAKFLTSEQLIDFWLNKILGYIEHND